MLMPSANSSTPTATLRMVRRRNMHGRAMEVTTMNRRRNEDRRGRRQNHGEAADIAIGARHTRKVGELRNGHHAERRLTGHGSRGIGSCHCSGGGEHEGGKLGFHEVSPRNMGCPIAADRILDGHAALY